MKTSTVISYTLMALIITSSFWLGIRWEAVKKQWDKYWVIEHIIFTKELKFVDKEALRYVHDQYIGKSFWDIDLSVMADKLENVNWIATVKISLTSHGTLRVDIKESHPIARWNKNGLVDENGKIFFPTLVLETEPEKYSHLVQFIGSYEKDIDDLLTIYVYFINALEEIYFTVEKVVKITEHDIKFISVNGIEIVIDKYDYPKQINRLLKVYHAEPSLAKYTYIDLRYKNGLAVSKNK